MYCIILLMLAVSTICYADGPIDCKLQHDKLDNKIAEQRMVVPDLKEEQKPKEELSVAKKRSESQSLKGSRVTPRIDKERHQKTRNVVAGY